MIALSNPNEPESDLNTILIDTPTSKVVSGARSGIGSVQPETQELVLTFPEVSIYHMLQIKLEIILVYDDVAVYCSLVECAQYGSFDGWQTGVCGRCCSIPVQLRWSPLRTNTVAS